MLKMWMEMEWRLIQIMDSDETRKETQAKVKIDVYVNVVV